ncbi:MAG: hypothetical protein SWX82_18965 [Cyanobacteriota bacterium]|nr:hypothetical protein [Cyanobacteriota bacterium]
MSKKKNGTQDEPCGTRGSENHNRVQLDPNEHTGGKGDSQEGENQSIGGGGEINSGKFTIESIRETFLGFTGKILRGLLTKSQNDKRVWEDRLQEARDCLTWYQNLLEKCEKEIAVADSQITEVEGMLSQLEQE